MVSLEYVDKVSELRMKIHEVKAVAEAFEDKFVSPADDAAVLNVKHEHDRYTHLYCVLFDLICEAFNKADELDGMSGSEVGKGEQ